MTSAELISKVREAGGSLEVREGGLRCRIPAGVADRLLPELREHKAEILATLCQRKPGSASSKPKAVSRLAPSYQPRNFDPAGDAVRGLLRPGEYIDELGVIRKVQ